MHFVCASMIQEWKVDRSCLVFFQMREVHEQNHLYPLFLKVKYLMPSIGWWYNSRNISRFLRYIHYNIFFFLLFEIYRVWPYFILRNTQPFQHMQHFFPLCIFQYNHKALFCNTCVCFLLQLKIAWFFKCSLSDSCPSPVRLLQLCYFFRFYKEKQH